MMMTMKRTDLLGTEFYTIIAGKLNHTHIHLVIVVGSELRVDDIVGGDDKVLNMSEIL